MISGRYSSRPQFSVAKSKHRQLGHAPALPHVMSADIGDSLLVPLVQQATDLGVIVKSKI